MGKDAATEEKVHYELLRQALEVMSEGLGLRRAFHYGFAGLLRSQSLDVREHALDLRPLAVREEPKRYRSHNMPGVVRRQKFRDGASPAATSNFGIILRKGS